MVYFPALQISLLIYGAYSDEPVSFYFANSILVEITQLSDSTQSKGLSAFINETMVKLNEHYTLKYADEYHLSQTTNYSALPITLLLTLNTNKRISQRDINETQSYIDQNISTDEYEAEIIYFSEQMNVGSTNDLAVEIIIICVLVLFIFTFLCIWFLRWRRREYYGKGETFLVEDYANWDNLDKDAGGFPTIDLKNEEDSKLNRVEMIKNVTPKEDELDDDDIDPEIDTEFTEEHDEEEEKAEEIDLQQTKNTTDGEELLVEDEKE